MKKQILVLFGGVSSEHDVSLISASSVIKNIDTAKFDVTMMGITKEGEFFVFTGSPEDLPEEKWLSQKESLKKAVISCDRKDHGIIFTDNNEKKYIDCVFPVLHGMNGEDGTIQGMLEISGIPFVGCDTAACAVCMDKALTNAMADFHLIAQAKWTAFTKYEYGKKGEKLLKEAEERLGYPIFVKPAKAGSSVGISKATDLLSLKKACEYGFNFDNKLVLEEGIRGKEIEVAVMGNDEPVASVPGEIVPCNDFYDYDAKYIANGSLLHIPATLSIDKLEEVRKEAVRAYTAMGCTGLSRCDFFVREGDERVMLNEINTIPGFTSISMFPKLFAFCGVPYDELIEKLIGYAIERKAE